MVRSKAIYSEPVVASNTEESSKSAVAWPAIFGGAVAATAVTIMLAFLGASIGLTSVSPWRGEGASASGFTVMAAIWLIIMQWVSSGLGGYLAGRLRTKFVRMHDDEVFFRDTAHGFLTWGVTTILTVMVVTSGITNAIGGGAKMAGGMAAGGAMGAAHGAAEPPHPGAGPNDGGPFAYYVDSLYRSDKPNGNQGDSRAETTRILMNDLHNGELTQDDENYLTNQVAARAGISQDEAKQRVDNTVMAIKDAEAKVKKAADDARKASAKAALFTFFSMLIGAFVASAAAALGGRQRDEYHTMANQ